MIELTNLVSILYLRCPEFDAEGRLRVGWVRGFNSLFEMQLSLPVAFARASYSLCFNSLFEMHTRRRRRRKLKRIRVSILYLRC